MFKRILVYSHDSYGLGHFRRTLTLAEYMLERSPETTVLAVTGSPRAHSFRLPHRFDYVKLPAATKDEGGKYCSRELDLGLDKLVGMRTALLRECARSLDPDLVLVDHAPQGLGGEVLPMLREARSRGARIVLGMRDIIDEPHRVRTTWGRDGTPEVLRTLYDAILLYGDRRLFDPVTAYGMSPEVAAKLVETGYVVRPGGLERPEAIRTRLSLDPGRRLVVVTAGGGGDGGRLLRNYLRGVLDQGPRESFSSLLVTGPLLSSRKRTQLMEMAADRDDVEIVEFIEELPDLYRAADLVISMGGYNSVSEILDARTPAIIVPRTVPRQEQALRARLLAGRNLVVCLPPDQIKGGRLMRTVRHMLQRSGSGPAGEGPRMDGLSGVWNALQSLSCRRVQAVCGQGDRVPRLTVAVGG